MKRFCVILLAATLLFSLSGCGMGNNGNEAEESGADASVQNEQISSEDIDSEEEILSEESDLEEQITSEEDVLTEQTTTGGVPLVELNNGIMMPRFGLGTFTLAGDTAYNSVLAALQSGYRHIDTAQAYANEESVGQAVADSGVPREEIWITSKLWPTDYGEDITPQAIDDMLERLGLEYLDLVYLHQPSGDYLGAWKGLEQCVEEGKIRAIGISNFDRGEVFDDLIANANIMPVAMQIECNPYAQRTEWQERLKEYNMVLECWFPLGGRGENGESLRDDPVIQQIAEAHGKSAVQVIVRWHIQMGFSVIPGSSNPEHIAENIDIFDFELTDEEMGAIRALDRDERIYDFSLDEIEDRFGSTELDIESYIED